MLNERCVSCGTVIPEGRQLCPRCEREGDSVLTNGDVVRSKSNRMFAEWIAFVASITKPSDVNTLTEWLDMPVSRGDTDGK